MQKRRIAIYSSIIPDDILDHLEPIKKLLLEHNEEPDDFVIITKDLLGYRPNHQAVFYDFYVTFYDCDIVFLYAKDMIDKYETIKSKNIYLYFLGNDEIEIPSHVQYTKLIGDNNEKKL